MSTGPSKKVRFEVLARDGFVCRYCGHAAPDVPLVVDHVRPRAAGGSNSPTNLVAACFDCNAGKSAMLLDAPPPPRPYDLRDEPAVGPPEPLIDELDDFDLEIYELGREAGYAAGYYDGWEIGVRSPRRADASTEPVALSELLRTLGGSRDGAHSLDQA